MEQPPLAFLPQATRPDDLLHNIRKLHLMSVCFLHLPYALPWALHTALTMPSSYPPFCHMEQNHPSGSAKWLKLDKFLTQVFQVLPHAGHPPSIILNLVPSNAKYIRGTIPSWSIWIASQQSSRLSQICIMLDPPTPFSDLTSLPPSVKLQVARNMGKYGRSFLLNDLWWTNPRVICCQKESWGLHQAQPCWLALIMLEWKGTNVYRENANEFTPLLALEIINMWGFLGIIHTCTVPHNLDFYAEPTIPFFTCDWLDRKELRVLP